VKAAGLSWCKCAGVTASPCLDGDRGCEVFDQALTMSAVASLARFLRIRRAPAAGCPVRSKTVELMSKLSVTFTGRQ
jgi:hypothetical protein